MVTAAAILGALLDKRQLGGGALSAKVGEVLQASGLKVGAGAIVDATFIIIARSSRGNVGEPDPHAAAAELTTQIDQSGAGKLAGLAFLYDGPVHC